MSLGMRLELLLAELYCRSCEVLEFLTDVTYTTEGLNSYCMTS